MGHTWGALSLQETWHAKEHTGSAKGHVRRLAALPRVARRSPAPEGLGSRQRTPQRFWFSQEAPPHPS